MGLIKIFLGAVLIGAGIVLGLAIGEYVLGLLR